MKIPLIDKWVQSLNINKDEQISNNEKSALLTKEMEHSK